MGLVISFCSFVFRRLIHKDWGPKPSRFEIQDGITFYDSERSPCARRVRMTLLEKKAKHRKVEVNLLKDEQSDPEYQKISPNRKVPAIAVRNVPGLEDCMLFESNVITEYLDEVLPGVKTYPADPWERAQAKMWQDWELSLADNFWPILYTNLLGFVLRMLHSRDSYIASLNTNTSPFQRDRNIRTFDGTLRDKSALETDALACYKALFALEKALKNRTYLVGDGFSTADLSVVPRLLMFESARIPISADTYPNTASYLARMNQRKCFADSESTTSRIGNVFLSWLFPLVVAIGNWRSGKTFRLFDGRHITNRAKAEWTEKNREIPTESIETSLDQVTIFNYAGAAECWQAKLLLKEKGVSFKTVDCDMLDLIGRTAGAGGLFRIQHGSRLVTGCRGLLDYLDSTFSSPRLIPTGALQKAQVQCWQAWEGYMSDYGMSHAIDVILLSKLLHQRFTEDNIGDLLDLRSDPRYTETFSRIMTAYMSRLSRDGDLWRQLVPEYGHLMDNFDIKQVTKDCSISLHERLGHLEESLTDKCFLVGDALSLADICVYCRLLYSPYMDVKISDQKYPNVCRWIADLRRRPHFMSVTGDVHELFAD